MDMNSEFMKKNINYVLPAVGIGIFILLYLLGVWFFQSHFVPNTNVGAISVSQLSLENGQAHIQKELTKQQMMLVELILILLKSAMEKCLRPTGWK